MDAPTATLDECQDDIGAWGDATFPHSTIDTVMAHLAEEVAEFFDDWRAGRETQEEEAADVLLLLLHYAHKRGFSLRARAAEKMALNRARRWKATPEPAGHVTHEAA